jgi:hypothetical protein
MAALRGLEIVNTKGMACPLCLFDFEDNGVAVVISCGGRHIICEGCYDRLDAHDARHIAGTYAHNAEERNRREEGEMYCPVCRGRSGVGQLVRSMNYDVMDGNDDMLVDEPDDVPDDVIVVDAVDPAPGTTRDNPIGITDDESDDEVEVVMTGTMTDPVVID